MEDGTGTLAEDHLVEGSLTTGTHVDGDESTVRRNLVRDSGSEPDNDFAAGIHAVGSGDVIDNTVSGVMQTSAIGIVVQYNPGGSIRDEEVIEAVRSAGVTMYFTGTRHFAH